MGKINIAELLKNCPIGMELDCTMYDNVKFNGVTLPAQYPIEILIPGSVIDSTLKLTEKGKFNFHTNAKCVIFPKGKTTWEGFVPPCPFKDGDVLFVDCSDDEEEKNYQFIFILNKPNFKGEWHSYCYLDGLGYFEPKEKYLTDDAYQPRFATEEEKEKLFQAIKDNDYKWNPETMSLEKLPMFKVGDKVRLKLKPNYVYTIHSLTWDDNQRLAYRLLPNNDKHLILVSLNTQDDYELLPSKFDISTLIPFESKVLVRNTKEEIWKPAIFGCYVNKKHPYYVLGGTCWKHCIPYESNTHLRGTTNDCDEYFKN